MTGTTSRDWRANAVAAVVGCLIFSALSIYLAHASASDLEADATTHFLNARYALHEPIYLVGVWGRPLCTCLYALTAHFGTPDQGRFYTRLLSLGLALACAVTTLAIGRRQGFRRPALVAICLLAQPLYFLHSFSELTEIPFAVLLMLGFFAYQRRKFFLMSWCVAFLPLGRPEGFGFIMMAALALLVHRKKRWLWILAVPFAIWNYAGWFIMTGFCQHRPLLGWIFNNEWWRWVMQNWPYSYESTYGSGRLLSFVARLPVLTSPFFFPFMLAGFALAIRWLWPHHNRPHLVGEPPSEESWLLGLTHLERCEILIALIPLSILVVHSLLWWRGKMGSNGELRYLLIVGPFFALLAARGWEWAWARFRWRAPLTFAGIAALVPIAANARFHVVPFPLYEEGIASRMAAEWYQAEPKIQRDFPVIMPTPPQVFYFMDISQTDHRRALPSCRETVSHPHDGALLLWDPIYGPHNSSYAMCVDRDLIAQHGWIHYRRFPCGDRYVEAYLSPRTASGDDTIRKYPDAFEETFELDAQAR